MTNPNYRFTLSLAGAFRSLGMTDTVITPGSRNTPLAIAFASTPGIENWIHHDERSAAFFALGLAKTTGRAVALVCTSGTAAAEYLPALTEARYARVPLVALTADRPAELRDVAAPQAIDQVRIYGTAVKWAHEAGLPDATFDSAPYATRLAASAWSRAHDVPAGPVHINCPFRDPLAPIGLPRESLVGDRVLVHPGTMQPDSTVYEAVARQLSGRRSLVVAGELPAHAAGPIVALAGALGAPIFADPLSQLRAGNHDRSNVITTGDTLARAGLLEGPLRPEVVIRFGSPPTSKALVSRLVGSTEQIVVDEAEWRDPTVAHTTMVRGVPGEVAAGLAGLVTPAEPEWLAGWVDAERTVHKLATQHPFPSEPGVVATLAAALPGGAHLWAANSMPIRDVDSFFVSTERPVSFFANRGANGIDGFLSTVFGSAAAQLAPTYAVCGDLSMVHDLTALASAVRLGLDATIVLVNNDGGGIFHFLPQADHPEFFESHLGTPHGLDFGPLVGGFGARYRLAESEASLAEAISVPPRGIQVIEVRTDRHENATYHRTWWQQTSAALAARFS